MDHQFIFDKMHFFQNQISRQDDSTIQSYTDHPMMSKALGSIQRLTITHACKVNKGTFGSLYGIFAPLRQRDGPPCASRTGHGS
jgi:hypothetical protein